MTYRTVRANPLPSATGSVAENAKPTTPAQIEPSPVLRGQTSMKGPLKHLDSIVRTGESISRAVNALDRTQLRALADRMDVLDSLATPQLRKVLKRRLVDAGGLVRESRAK